MKVFTLIEIDEWDIFKVMTFLDEDTANARFDILAHDAEELEIDADEWRNTHASTLRRCAGRATYFLELHETETEH